MESMSQIIAAMLSMSPQVTPMGAPGGGGGGSVNVPAMGGSSGGMSAGRERQGSPMKVSPIDIPNMGSPDGGGAPQMSGMGEGNTNPATGGGMPTMGEDPQALLKTYVEAQQDVQRIQLGADTAAGRWVAKKELPQALEKKAWAQNNINLYLQEKQKREDMRNADQILQTARPIVGDDQARKMAQYALNNPDDSKMLMEQLIGEATDVRKTDAAESTRLNVEDIDFAEKAQALLEGYPDAPGELISAIVQTGASFPELTDWLDGRQEYGDESVELMRKDYLRRMASSDSSKRIIHQISGKDGIRELVEGTEWATGGLGGLSRKAMNILDPEKEGVPGRFSSFLPAGELDRKVDPIISKIGLETINKMREMSASGGALGNVSNFEVQMVQAALASLNTGQGKEEFIRSLDIVEQSFKRAAFLADNVRDLEKSAKKAGIPAYQYITQELDRRYPINPEFEKQMNLDDAFKQRKVYSGQNADNTPPQMVDPNRQINIPTDPVAPGGQNGVYNPETGEIEWQ